MLQNSTQRKINKLKQKKYRQQSGEFLVEGVKGVGEAIQSEAEVVLIVIEEKRKSELEFSKIVKQAHVNNIMVEFCAQSDIGKIKTVDTFPGILAIVEKTECDLEEITGNNIICLDNINDPGNLGTIIRTANWFGIETVILSKNCVDLYNPKVVRSTMGSIFKVKVLVDQDLPIILKMLKKEKKYQLAGLVMTKGEDILKIDNKTKTAYVLGSESHGISEHIENLLDKRYTIKGKGDAESLNVAISAGILMNKLNLLS